MQFLFRVILLAGAVLLMSTQTRTSHAAAPAAAAIQPQLTSHNISISIDISTLTVKGRDLITLNNRPESLKLVIRRGSSIDTATAEGRRLKVIVKESASKGLNETVIKLPAAPKGGRDAPITIELGFHGSFSPVSGAREKIRRGVAFVDDGVIGEEGVFLPSDSAWFPREEAAMAVYDAVISLPMDYTTVMEGSLIRSVTSDGIKTEEWKTDSPSMGLNLVAGRYTVTKETYKGIEIGTFFFEKDDTLTRTYINKTKGYLDMYAWLIGPYPFKKFAIVESFLPTGYGMPSFTLLGSAVIRLPFIPDTSLGHEIAHNWWGNSVYSAGSGGNWTEALTTFTADYLYAEKKGADREFRFLKLLGYKNFAEAAPLTLGEFSDATEPVSRAIGYNKGAMLFVMLRDEVGTDAFSTGLRAFYSEFRFKNASWADIRRSFEKASGKDLGWFFDQWLGRPGGPAISIEGPILKWDKGAKYLIQFTIRQTNPHTLTLPVRFETTAGVVRLNIKVSKEVEPVYAELAAAPLAFEIDPDYGVFRILSDAETPASLSSCFGDRNAVIVVPSQKEAADKYEALASLISKDYGAAIAAADDVASYEGKTVFILGGPGENPAFDLVKERLPKETSIDGALLRLADGAYDMNGGLFALALKDTKGGRRAVCAFFGAGSKETVFETGKRLRYFGESSWLVFNGGSSPTKGRFSGKNSLRHEF